MKSETDIKLTLSGERTSFEALRKAIEVKIKTVDIDDFDSIIDLESDIMNMKNSHNYYDGLKYALSEETAEVKG